MKIDDLTTKWNTVPASETSFQRIDDEHVLDIFVGKDGENQKELMIISDLEPARITPSRSLDIQKGIRKDGRWSTRIKLLKKEEEEVFTHLCWDLIEHSRKAATKMLALEIFISRFLKWQKLMESGRDLLSEEAIKGIIGELLYAENYLYRIKDWDAIFDAWLGPDGADKDFVFDDTWVEVKAISHGKSTVTISSLEQLTSPYSGCLAVFTVDATSPSDVDGFCFAGLVNRMRELLKASPNALLQYESKLMELGYSEHREYYEKYYVFRGARFFIVKEGFPRLDPSSVPTSIVKVKYDISLPELSAFEMEESS